MGNKVSIRTGGEDGAAKKAEALKQLCSHLQEGTQSSHLHTHAVQGTLGEL